MNLLVRSKGEGERVRVRERWRVNEGESKAERKSEVQQTDRVDQSTDL